MAVGILASGDPVGVRRGDDDDTREEDEMEEDEVEVEDELCKSSLDDVMVCCGAGVYVDEDCSGPDIDADEGCSVVTGIDDEDSGVTLLDGKKGITVSSNTDVELDDEATGDDRVLSEAEVVRIDWLDGMFVKASLLDTEVDDADDCGGTKVMTVAPSSR